MSLQAVIDHPELDEPRLQFATSVEHLNPAWARYIRRAVERHQAHGYCSKAPEELHRELEAPFRALGVEGCELDRGFVATVYLPVDAFIANGEALTRLGPVLSVVLDEPGYGHWNEHLPRVARARALARVRELVLGARWGFDYSSLLTLIESSNTDALLRLETPESFRLAHPNLERDAQEAAMWPKLFESPTFRRMVNWGLGNTRRKVGDRVHVVSPESDFWEVTTYEPMPAEDRELERRYGYIPALHATNWNASVLDVLRGKKPDFPSGAPQTEAMYAVPPAKTRSLGPEWS